jgi:pimeloyl-ACP methyl ester carboxylesterase
LRYTEAESRRVEVNGVVLNLTDWGGAGRGVLFSHATGFLGAVWEPVIAELRSGGFGGRILTYDQRGHGLSSKPDSGYDWNTFIRDLGALMEAEGLTGLLGVGHSAGATTVACLAADQPGCFSRLLLIDPILFDPEEMGAAGGQSNPLAERARTRRMVWASREELSASFGSRPPYDSWDDEALAVYVDYGSFERPDGEVELLCPGRIEAQVYANAGGLDGFARLAGVAVPTLIVRGRDSDAFPAQRAARTVATIPGSRLVTVDGSHFVVMERPAEIARLVVAEAGS